MRHAFFQCPRVMEIWKRLGLDSYVAATRAIGREGSSVLAELLSDETSTAPFLHEVRRGDLIAMAI